MSRLMKWLPRSGTPGLAASEAKSLSEQSSLPLREVEEAWKAWDKMTAKSDSRLRTPSAIADSIDRFELTEPLLRLRSALCGQDASHPLKMESIGTDDAAVRRRVQEELAEMALRMFDVDGDGSLDFREFLVGMAVLSNGSPDEKARLQFRVMDLDGNRYITHDEAAHMVRTVTGSFKIVAFYEIRKKLLLSGLDGPLVEEIERQVDACWDLRTTAHCELYSRLLLEMADTDADGQVSEEEYVRWQADEAERLRFFRAIAEQLAPVEHRFQVSLQDSIQRAFLAL